MGFGHQDTPTDRSPTRVTLESEPSMLSTRPFRLSLIGLAVSGLLVLPSSGIAQVTKSGTAPAQSKPKAKTAEPTKAAEPIDLNSATSEQLTTLPGIGEAFARRIIENRPHKAVADLAQSGIPSTTVDKLGPLVVVRPLPPAVEINEDSTEKLETLPGVGPALAKEIIAGRPFSKYDDLAKLKGFGPKKIDELRGRIKFGKAEPAIKKAVPAIKQEAPAKTKTSKTASETSKPAMGGMVNLNSATAEELQVLPGIGPAYSKAIIEARPFTTIQDVMKVKGIKEVEFGKIKDRITVK